MESTALGITGIHHYFKLDHKTNDELPQNDSFNSLDWIMSTSRMDTEVRGSNFCSQPNRSVKLNPENGSEGMISVDSIMSLSEINHVLKGDDNDDDDDDDDKEPFLDSFVVRD
jgi:hypothetical protein